MRSFIVILVTLFASRAFAVDYRITVDAPKSPFKFASYQHEAAQPIDAKTVSLPRFNLGGCPGGVCAVPQSPAVVREKVVETVRSVAVVGNRPVLTIVHRAASLVQGRQPVRNAVRGAVGLVRRLLGR